MFYLMTLQRVVTVQPRDLNATLYRSILNYLRKAVEGLPIPQIDDVASKARNVMSPVKTSALLVAVTDILNADKLQGKVQDNGSVTFHVTYQAIVLKLHRAEVLDVVVKRISAEGWYGSVFGVGYIFVNQAQMSPDLDAPVWTFENVDAVGMWTNASEGRSIKPEDIVRVRVIGETPQSQDAMAIGTIVGPYLGPV